jgi:3-hydroxyacyl-CoA dehydrogenase/enoyl-CoA hydratase/3-hydroxybutyryl-CoA epimerase
MKSFEFEIEEQGIGYLKIDVPNETMNVLKAEFVAEVNQILDTVEANKKLKGLIVYSGKDNSFIAGADIKMLDDCPNASAATALAQEGQKLFERIEKLHIPVVAAIHGVCLGGGLELALACQRRICSDAAHTQLALPEVQLGLLPGSGGTQRLPRLVGLAPALQLMLTGKKVRPKQAKRMGLVDEVVAPYMLLDAAKKALQKTPNKRRHSGQPWWMRLIESMPQGRSWVGNQALKAAHKKTKGLYPAPPELVAAVLAGQKLFCKPDYHFESNAFGRLVATPESQALRSIFFATTEMKKETGAGRTKPREIQKVGVVGGGLMGSGIVNVTAVKAKIAVRIKEISPKGLNSVLAYSYTQLKRQYQRRFLTRLDLHRTLSRISTGLHYKGMFDADVVIEAVFESLELKHTIVHELERHCSPQTIIASNTSSLPIADIASVAKRPQNIVGLHYFSPVEKMPLVEVIPHAKTSPETIATVVSLAKKQGKTPIVVQDGAGFYVNRILALYMCEAAHLLMEGVSIADLDQAAVNFGFPLGPFDLLDQVGIDVSSKIVPILATKLGERFQVIDVFEKLIEDRRLGKKSKKGFYKYGAQKGKQKSVDASVYKVLRLNSATKPLPANAFERCFLQMLNEAGRCLEEKIIACPRDGDIGAIFGIGFPPFLGGPFQHMDRVGLQEVHDKLTKLSQDHGSRFAPCQQFQTMLERNEKFYE